MAFRTAITELLHIEHPLLQAPMAGVSTPDMAAAVSNAGGLGSLGVALMAPAAIRDAIRSVRAKTDRPFGVNLFVPPWGDDGNSAGAPAPLAAFRQELGIGSVGGALPPWPDYREQLSVILEERPPVFSFCFNVPTPEDMQALASARIVTIGTATTLREGQALVAAGVASVVAQGHEAGGHRGTFLGKAEDALVGTLALVPQLVDRLRVPVIAAGGIMDGRGMLAGLALGAAAVQMGTAFITCPESAAHASYKKALAEVQEDGTAITWAFSGRPARAVRNRFVAEMAPHRQEFLPFPQQRGAVAAIVQEAAKQGRTDLMQMWSGQGVGLLRPRSAHELVLDVVREAEEARATLEGARR
jgi:nitronate monooxygenase